MIPHSLCGRPWDSFDAYLFDIDGTLLRCSDAVHYYAFCDTLRSVCHREATLDGVNAHGNTDIGILRDALKLAGIAEAEWRPRLPQMREAMCRFVEDRKNAVSPVVLPKVAEVLAHLRYKEATLGIATGNLRAIGRLKLQRAGLLDFFQVAGWSDAFEYREDVFGGALKQMRAATFRDAAVCAVGDTPADVTAARANGLPVIAVATGVHSQDQLAAAKPDLCLRSFEELFSVL